MVSFTLVLQMSSGVKMAQVLTSLEHIHPPQPTPPGGESPLLDKASRRSWEGQPAAVGYVCEELKNIQ
ncbi:hypothetical protein BgiMline_019273 [Biomphalaria glabrata]|nr:hypothetical protein BgiMline_032144 [Biomphalaria glabrata]